MKISTQTGTLFRVLGEAEAIALFKRAGYDALDYSMFHMSDDSSPLNKDDYIDYAKYLRKIADDNGIVFNQCHAPFTFKWEDPEIYNKVAIPRIERSLEVAGILGVDTAVVHPIHHMVYKGHEDEIRQLNLDYYASLLPLCERYGIRVCIENMWQRDVKRRVISDDVGSRAADLAYYVDEINSPYFAACLDLGHCGIVGEEAQDAIRILGSERLAALHVHDNDYTGDQHTLPGLGRMEWAEIMKALREIGYKGYFTYEADAFLKNFDKGFLEEAVRFMVIRARYLCDMIV